VVFLRFVTHIPQVCSVTILKKKRFFTHPSTIVNTPYAKKYQKEKAKAKYIILFLSAAVALLGAGFALAPLFIASTIILPVLPVLLFGFAIIAITKFCLNIKIKHQESVRDAKNILDELEQVEKQLVKENFHAQLSKSQNLEILNTISEKILDLRDQNSINHAEVSDLLKRGLFNKNIHIEDSANQPVKIEEHIASGPSN
jgi:hypothetical protein